MQSSDQIFTFFKTQCQPWIVGVDQHDLDSFIQQYNLTLRQDHYDYLLEYGNSTDVLTGYIIDFTLPYIQKTYQDFDELLAGDIPDHTVYFGDNGGGETIAICYKTGEIWYFDEMKKTALAYKSIRCFLFHKFLYTLWSKSKFDEIQQLIKVPDVDKFMKDNEQYYLAGMDTYHYKYYLNQNMIVELEHKIGFAKLFKGGVLNTFLEYKSPE